MKQVAAYWSLLRVHNCLIALVGVAVGQKLSVTAQPLPLCYPALAAAFFVCAFGNVINDIVDVATDQINHPKRPLPSRMISISRARTLAFLLLVISLVLAFFVNWTGLIIVTLSLVMVTLYNLRWKRSPLIGNLAVSLLGAFTFLLGGAMAGPAGLVEIPGAAIPAVFAFIFHLGREIVKDVQDMAGDKIGGSRTAPIAFGITGSLRLANLLFGLAIALSLAVYWAGWFDRAYLLLVTVGVLVPLAVEMIVLGRSPDRQRIGFITSLMRWQMVIGMIALLLGRQY